MSEQRPDIIRRKAQLTDEKPARKILVDFLKSSAIITAEFTGTLTLQFYQGGIRSTKIEIIDPL